jgi:prophage maintenance system killer protein
MAMYTFLGMNGHEVAAEEEDVVRVMLAVAAGEWREEQLADWVRTHLEPLPE